MSSPYKALMKFLYAFRNMQAFKYCKSTAPFQPWHICVMKKADNRLTFISWSFYIIQPIFLNRLQDRAKLSFLRHQWSLLPSVPTHVKHSCKQRTDADKNLPIPACCLYADPLFCAAIHQKLSWQWSMVCCSKSCCRCNLQERIFEFTHTSYRADHEHH